MAGPVSIIAPHVCVTFQGLQSTTHLSRFDRHVGGGGPPCLVPQPKRTIKTRLGGEILLRRKSFLSSTLPTHYRSHLHRPDTKGPRTITSNPACLSTLGFGDGPAAGWSAAGGGVGYKSRRLTHYP